MSLAFSGTACNMGSYFNLTSATNGATGGITLSNLDIPISGCVSRFWASSLNQGSTKYSWGDFVVDLNGSSNMIYLNYGATQISSGSCTFSSGSNQVAVRYAPSTSNTAIRVYLNNSVAHALSTGNTYSLSSGVHSWSGINTTSSSKTISTPLVENLVSFYNSVNIEDSLRVKNNLTIGGTLTVPTLNATTTNFGNKLQVSNFGLGTNYVGMNHSNMQVANAADYGTIFDSTGNTFVNCSAGRSLFLRQNNVDKAKIDNDGVFRFYTPVQHPSARNLGVTYFCDTTYMFTISTGSLPYFAHLLDHCPYSSAMSCIGSDFSSFNTTANSFCAPATGLYEWTLFIPSTADITWHLGSMAFYTGGLTHKGYIQLAVGDYINVVSEDFTTSNPPPSQIHVVQGTYLSVVLLRETY